MLALIALTTATLFLHADTSDAPLGDWFGFSGVDVLPVGDEPGPMRVADMDADGLTDVVIANNRKSRIEILRQRPVNERLDQPAPPASVNEFPEHEDFERVLVPVADRVQAMLVHDINGDGRADLLLAGTPGRITSLLQQEDGTFEKDRHRDVRHLAASPAAFALADIVDDTDPELISIVDGDLVWWPLHDGRLGVMQRRPAGTNLVAVVPADYDGDGLVDVAGIAPDDDAPIRIWFTRQDGASRSLGGQTPFEMPPLIEFEPVHIPGQDATRIAVIERASRRIVLYDVEQTPTESDAAITLMGFADAGNRDRPVVLADADNDGLTDVITADTKGNALAVFRQQSGTGLLPPTSSPSVAQVDGLAWAPSHGDRAGELIVLSTEEGFVGRASLKGDGMLTFPSAVQGEKGWDPKAIAVAQGDQGSTLAIVRNAARKYVLDLVPLDGGEAAKIDLGSLSRPPTAVLVADADQDGRNDFLLLTADRPMLMVLAEEDGTWSVLEKDDMGQYGLVGEGSAASMSTTDIDGDGQKELLSAARNYVRALRYNRDGDAPGWEVIQQINADDAETDLNAVTPMNGSIVVSDRETNRLLVLEQDGQVWTQRDIIDLPGIEPHQLHTGTLAGDGSPTILVLGDDAMAIVTRSGSHVELTEADTWRSSAENHFPHELAVGDVNDDGHIDLLALDAGKQMLEILTFTDAGRMLYATGFPVFESRLFSGGEGREFQPRQAEVADVNNDGLKDVVLLTHDRVLVYPQ